MPVRNEYGMNEYRIGLASTRYRHENHLNFEYGTKLIRYAGWIDLNTASCKHQNTVRFHTACNPRQVWFINLNLVLIHSFRDSFWFTHSKRAVFVPPSCRRENKFGKRKNFMPDSFLTGVTGPDAPLQMAPPRASGTRTRCLPRHLVLGPDAPLHRTGLSSIFETNF